MCVCVCVFRNLKYNFTFAIPLVTLTSVCFHRLNHSLPILFSSLHLSSCLVQSSLAFLFFFHDLLKTKNKQKSKTPKTLLFTIKENHPDIFLNINIFMKNLLPPVKSNYSVSFHHFISYVIKIWDVMFNIV